MKANLDELVKSQSSVTPAKTGVHNSLEFMGSRVGGNDRNGTKQAFYEGINLEPMGIIQQ